MSIFDMLLANAMGESGGGGGSSDFEQIEVVVTHSGADYAVSRIDASYNELLALINNGKIPFFEFTAEEAEGLTNSGYRSVSGKKYALIGLDVFEDYYSSMFYALATTTNGDTVVPYYFGTENADENMPSS